MSITLTVNVDQAKITNYNGSLSYVPTPILRYGSTYQIYLHWRDSHGKDFVFTDDTDFILYAYGANVLATGTIVDYEAYDEGIIGFSLPMTDPYIATYLGTSDYKDISLIAWAQRECKTCLLYDTVRLYNSAVYPLEIVDPTEEQSSDSSESSEMSDNDPSSDSSDLSSDSSESSAYIPSTVYVLPEDNNMSLPYGAENPYIYGGPFSSWMGYWISQEMSAWVLIDNRDKLNDPTGPAWQIGSFGNANYYGREDSSPLGVYTPIDGTGATGNPIVTDIPPDT
jgi:hypothetical protein